jgi:hypothetical protein
MPRARAEQLLKLAVWYREYAERTGNPEIWASRIRAAERLEEEAAQMDAVARFPLPKTGGAGFRSGELIVGNFRAVLDARSR